MGEIADMMLDGTLCEGCGEFMEGKSPGQPRRCIMCRPNYERISLSSALKRPLSTAKATKAHRESMARSTKRVCCKFGCNKMFRTVPGMLQHALTVHREKRAAVIAIIKQREGIES